MKLLIGLSVALLFVGQAQADISADIANGMTIEQAAQAALGRGESLETIAEQLYAEGESVESVTVALIGTGATDQAVLNALYATQASAPTAIGVSATLSSEVTSGFEKAGRNPPSSGMLEAANTVGLRPPYIARPVIPNLNHSIKPAPIVGGGSPAPEVVSPVIFL